VCLHSFARTLSDTLRALAQWWPLDGNDYTAIGLGLELVGGYLLGRGLGLLRPLSFETTGTWADDVRSRIYSQWEARFGFSCFLLGLFGSLLGTIRSAHAGGAGLLRDALWLFLGGVAVVAVALLWTLPLLVDRIAKRRYRPRIRESQRGWFEESLFALANDWRFPSDPPNVTLTPDERKRRMGFVTTRLDNIANLFEEPRKAGETDAALAERLRKFFP
jgi:hypothetical protein